jgi:uncharacterized protein
MSWLGVAPQLIAELALLGICTGFLAGLLGVGGGMMLVPFLSLILSHRGVGADRWDILRGMAPGILIGGLLCGAGVFALVKGQALALFFAAFVAYSASHMLLAKAPEATRRLPGRIGQAAVGGGIGLLAGLVGAGGAFIAVPFMLRCNVPIHNAIGTGAAIGFPIALANTLGYVVGGWSVPPALPGAVGFVYLPALVIIALASVLSAPLGTHVSHALNVRQLRRIFAVMLYALAADMLRRGLPA